MLILSADTECTGPAFHKNDRPFYLSTCDSDGNTRCWRFQVDPKTRLVTPQKKTILDIVDYFYSFEKVVFHNAKFDLRALASIGITLDFSCVEDTLLQSHCYDNKTSHKLKDQAETLLGVPVDDETLLLRCIAKARTKAKALSWAIAKSDKAETEGEPWMKMDGWLPGQLWELDQSLPLDWKNCLEAYGTLDAERTMGLFLLYHQWLQGEGSRYLEAYRRQLAVLPALIGMEQRGVSLRKSVLISNVQHYEERSQALQEPMRIELGNPEFNPRSPVQLQSALFGHFGLPPVKATKTGYSTDKEVLAYLFRNHRNKFLEHLLAYRKCSTSLNYLTTYLESAFDSRLHSSFNPVGTDTTRLSSSNPNMQNVGKGSEFNADDDWGEVMEDNYRLREVFGPLPGRVWLDFDYDQLQLRIFAYVSGETRLIKAFEEGWDAHNFVACQIYKTDEPTKLQRRVAKSVNFGFIFGAQEEKITAVSGDPKVWQTVNELFPNAVRFLEDTSNQVRKTGYVEVGLPGYPGAYRLFVPRDRWDRIKAYTGVCYKVQGLEGLIVKLAMSYWHKYLTSLCKVYRDNNYGYLSLQVHDELIADFRSMSLASLTPHALTLKKLMEKAGSVYGVVTPASMSVVTESWASPIDWSAYVSA